MRTTEVQEANGQYQYSHATRTNHAEKETTRMTTTATNTTPSEEENAHPPSNGSREDENNKKSDNNDVWRQQQQRGEFGKEVGNSADGAANIDTQDHQQQEHSTTSKKFSSGISALGRVSNRHS